MLIQPKFWQEKKSFKSCVLSPLSYLYQWIGRCRSFLKRPYQADIPVICVGNVTLGGAGKTPVVRLIVSLLHHGSHLNVQIVTRGYKGQIKVPTRVSSGAEATMVGDEAILLSKTAPCWVGVNRRRVIERAKLDGAALVVMDDGFQNPSIFKDLSILVIDGPFGLGNGFVFPAGPLREPLHLALKRADAVIIIGEDKQHLINQVSSVPVFKAEIQLWPNDVAPRMKRGVYAFTGIGRPEKFFNSLRQAGITFVKHQSFPDHYQFSENDLENIMNEADLLDLDVVTTEKDYVRLSPHWQNRIYQIRSDIILENTPLFQKFLIHELERIQKKRKKTND